MSEPPPVVPQPEHSGDTPTLPEDEKTQPTQEILDALRQLNPQSFAPVAQNSTDDLSSLKQEPTPPPPSEWEATRAALRSKPTDAELWLRLVDLAEDSGNIETVKDTYEALLEAYPNTVRVFSVDACMCSTSHCLHCSVLGPNRVPQPLPGRPCIIWCGRKFIPEVPEEVALGGSLEVLPHIHQVSQSAVVGHECI